MIMKQLMEALNQMAPEAYAMSRDNVGLLIGRPEREVKKVYLTLDVTAESLEAAAEAGCDTILSHHPMIFSAVKKVRGDDFTGRRILEIAERGMNYYAMHTNFDIAVMADICAERLGITNDAPLEPTGMAEDRCIGIGSISHLEKPVSLAELAKAVKEKFDLPGVRVYGNPQQEISCVAMCPGSGKGMSGLALGAGAQVFVTGDIDHHTALDSLEEGLCTIDAGHHGLEHIYVDYMEGWLKALAPELAIVKDHNHSPFSII